MTEINTKFLAADESGEEVNATVELEGRGISLRVEGYGDASTMPGYGSFALLERYEGELRLVVWADISSCDPTHIISLEGASEEARPPFCLRCGSSLEKGLCTDETCGFSEHQQSCPVGMVSHPDGPGEDTKCTCK